MPLSDFANWIPFNPGISISKKAISIFCFLFSFNAKTGLVYETISAVGKTLLTDSSNLVNCNFSSSTNKILI